MIYEKNSGEFSFLWYNLTDMKNNLQISRGRQHIIYALGFLLSFSIALPAYINSTFLKEYVSEKFVGLIFTIGSLLTLFALVNIPKILQKFTLYKTVKFLIVFQSFSLVLLAVLKSPLFLFPLFALYLVMIPLLRFGLDVFLENYSEDVSTGKIRGKYLTAANIAWVLSPAITGAILTNGDYWKIYILASAFMLPIFYLIHIGLKDFKDPKYEKTPFLSTMKDTMRNKNMRNIFMSNFLLYFFYSWMVIYMPIYLHEHIGFEWTQIGLMFTIMLLPFVFLQFPAGRLADTKWGEKEFLSIGFVAMAITSVVLFFIDSQNFFVWAAALFATRVGTSVVEIMIETYFFKQIDSGDTNILGFFRDTTPFAYIIAPIIASGFLYFFDLQYLFLALGGIMISGLVYSLTLEDTK
jgi:MFS family permease